MSKLQANPFFNRQRVTDAAYFYGRQTETEALYSAIATRQCRSVVGERKLGKSSLLTHVMRGETVQLYGLKPEDYLFVYIDLEGMANITYEEFWEELCDRIEMALPAEQTRLREMAADLVDGGEVRFTQIRRLLRRVDRAGLTVVMMLDEFESLARNAAFSASFYGELRSLAGEMGVVYITASKKGLYELTYEHADTLSSPFFNIFSEQPLGLMAEAEARGLLQKLSATGGEAPFTDEEMDYLLRLAGPHPFFLQVAAFYGYELRENFYENRERIRRRFAAEAEDHYRYLWSQLSQTEQISLVDVAHLEGDMKRQLRSKALVKEAEGSLAVFNQTFAQFVQEHKPVGSHDSTITQAVPRRSSGTSTDLTGITLGNFRVLTSIGHGGMATVYKGYQPSLDRYVAIKVMANHLGHNSVFRDRFQREASSVAQLRHQHVVQMVDFGLQDEIMYMVMEYIGGGTLKERLREVTAKGERLRWGEVLQVTQHMASALDYAHAHGIVHRDVKPANTMLRPEEKLSQLTGEKRLTAVLTDFGVARMLEGVQLTGTGAAIGTPDYMSPEQASGEPAEPASDIYALGVVVYEMLTGELPFRAATPVAVLFKQIHDEPPAATAKVPQLPAEVEPILARALAKDPRQRYATATALATDLTHVLEANR
ncbi:MAG TPA: protein kinase [Anaerolineae bacterium]|nr:protein kinase [Anaerolineae bacterium]